MIADFLAADGGYSGRWERDEPAEPEPVSPWGLRIVALALLAFWGAILTSAVAMLP